MGMLEDNWSMTVEPFGRRQEDQIQGGGMPLVYGPDENLGRGNLASGQWTTWTKVDRELKMMGKEDDR